MPWYAIDAVSDGVDETKALLFPFDLKRWLTLAVMTFFVAGGSGANVPSSGFQTGTPSDPGDVGGVGWLPHVSPELVLGVIAALVLLALVVALVGSVLEFAFVDSLRSRDVRIRGRFGARFWKGVRLFGFRLALFLLVLAVLAALIAPLVLAIGGHSPVFLVLWVLAIPIALLIFVVVALVQEFTTSFVVPLICERGGTILGTWRALWSGIRAEWKQFGLFVLVKFGLGIAAGFAMGVGMTLVVLPVFVLLGAGLLAGSVSPALVGAAAVLALLLYLVVLVAVQMPITVFLRYHALCTLDATEMEWALRESVEEAVE